MDGRSSVNALSLVVAGIRTDNATTLRLKMAARHAVASRFGPAIHKPVLVRLLYESHVYLFPEMHACTHARMDRWMCLQMLPGM